MVSAGTFPLCFIVLPHLSHAHQLCNDTIRENGSVRLVANVMLR